MEEEGKLIDGFLRHLDESPNPQTLGEYVTYILFTNDRENYNAHHKVIKTITQRIEQFDLVYLDGKKYKLEGKGKDVLEVGGYEKWREIEEDKIKRQKRQQDGTYVINKFLAVTAFFSFYLVCINFIPTTKLMIN